jgi:glycosyltransferase involved in cell wall biosynthesis
VSVLHQAGGDLEAEFAFAESLVKVPEFEWDSCSHPLRSWRRIREAVGVGAELSPDVVWGQRFDTGPWASAVSRRTGAAAVCHLHGYATRRALVLNRALALGVDRYIAVSDFIRAKWLELGIAEDRIVTVHNGIDPREYPVADPATRRAARAEFGLSDDTFVLLYVGRVAEEKGLPHLLDAWRATGLDRDGSVLLVVGDGTPDYVRRLRETYPSPSIRWIGRRRDVVGPMHAADLAVLPAVWDEPFGRVVIETMATGCPVVATRAGGIPEILDTPRLRHLLVERESSDEIADRLVALRQWRTTHPQLGSMCRARVEEHFTIEAATDQILDVFQQAIDDRPGRRATAYAAD